MLIDCCAMEKMFNRPCSFDGGAFDNFTDSCRWFQIDPLITTLFISIRFLADLLHSLSPHCYAQVLRTAGMDGKAIEIGEIAKQLSSFSSSHLFRLGASELMVTCPFQCLHYQAERLCRLNPVYQEPSVKFNYFNSCLVLCNFYRIKLSAPRAGERTTSPRVSEFNSTLCTGGGRIYLMVSVGTQVEVLWNAMKCLSLLLCHCAQLVCQPHCKSILQDDSWQSPCNVDIRTDWKGFVLGQLFKNALSGHTYLKHMSDA